MIIFQKCAGHFFEAVIPLTFVFIVEVQVIIVPVVLRERRTETTNTHTQTKVVQYFSQGVKHICVQGSTELEESN